MLCTRWRRTPLLAALFALALGGAGWAQEKPAEAPAKGTQAAPAKGEQAAPEKAPKNDPEAVAAIDRYLQAIGGRETLQAIKDKTLRFTNSKFTPTGVTPMKMARFLKRPMKIREEWELSGVQELTKNGKSLHFLQVYNGDKGWVKAMGFVDKLTGKTLTLFVWDKFIDNFFMHWKDDGYTVKYLGETQVAGNPAVGVETTAFAGGQKVRYFFNKADGLLLKKEWVEKTGNNLSKQEMYYSDYQKIRFTDNPDKWIQMPTKEKVFQDGELSLEKEYTEIKLNDGLDDSLFERPEGPQFQGRQPPKKAQPAPKKAEPAQPTSRPATPNGKAPEEKPKEKEKPSGR